MSEDKTMNLNEEKPVGESESDINIIEMQDEDGNTLQFEHLLTFEADDQFYIAFTPIEKMQDFDVDEVLIMRIKEEEDEDVFLPIESDEELEQLWAVFQELYYADDEESDE